MRKIPPCINRVSLFDRIDVAVPTVMLSPSFLMSGLRRMIRIAGEVDNHYILFNYTCGPEYKCITIICHYCIDQVGSVEERQFSLSFARCLIDCSDTEGMEIERHTT